MTKTQYHHRRRDRRLRSVRPDDQARGLAGRAWRRRSRHRLCLHRFSVPGPGQNVATMGGDASRQGPRPGHGQRGLAAAVMAASDEVRRSPLPFSSTARPDATLLQIAEDRGLSSSFSVPSTIGRWSTGCSARSPGRVTKRAQCDVLIVRPRPPPVRPSRPEEPSRCGDGSVGSRDVEETV